MSRVSDIADTKQCSATLGDISCTKLVVCYLCGAPIMPHWTTFTNQNHVCNTTSSSLWNFGSRRYKDPPIKPIYPQCEHIMPCNPKFGKINIPGRRQHLSIVKIGIVYKSIHSDDPEPRVLDPTTVVVTGLNEKDKYLKLILTLNYAWSHAYCNSPCKSNKILIDYSGNKYIKNVNNIPYMKALISHIFKDKIKTNINSFKNASITMTAPTFTGIDKRLNHIIKILNNINKYFPSVTDMVNLTKHTDNFFKGGGNENKTNFINILDILESKIISKELPNKINFLEKIDTIKSKIQEIEDDILFLNLNHLFLNLEDISVSFFVYLIFIIDNYKQIDEYSNEYSRILNLKQQKKYELFIKFMSTGYSISSIDIEKTKSIEKNKKKEKILEFIKFGHFGDITQRSQDMTDVDINLENIEFDKLYFEDDKIDETYTIIIFYEQKIKDIISEDKEVKLKEEEIQNYMYSIFGVYFELTILYGLIDRRNEIYSISKILKSLITYFNKKPIILSPIRKIEKRKNETPTLINTPTLIRTPKRRRRTVSPRITGTPGTQSGGTRTPRGDEDEDENEDEDEGEDNYKGPESIKDILENKLNKTKLRRLCQKFNNDNSIKIIEKIPDSYINVLQDIIEHYKTGDFINIEKRYNKVIENIIIYLCEYIVNSNY